MRLKVNTMADRKTIQFYNLEASRYAAATAPHSMDEHIDRFTALLPRGASILDLGCGGGRDLASFAKRSFDAVGLDAAIELAKLARTASGRPVVVGDIARLPLKDGSFDAVWASASLLHLPRGGINEALAGIRGVLGAGGLFFSSLKIGNGEMRTSDSRFFTYFNLSEWSDLLANAGFQLLESQCDPETPVYAGDRWMNTIARSNL